MDSAKEIIPEMIETTKIPEQISEIEGDAKTLVRKLHLLGNRLANVNALSELCRGFIIIAGIISAEVLLDWLIDLNLAIRAIFLVGDLILLSWFLWRKVLIHFIRKKDEEDLALLVEKHFPVFKDRLISSIQLVKVKPEQEGISSALLKSLISETEKIARPINFNSIVDTKPLVKLLTLAILCLTICLVLCINYGDTVLPLIKRLALFNEEIPRKTKVNILTGDKVIGRGDSILISAKASGIIPSEGELIIAYESGRTAKYSLERDKTDRTLFSRELENVQDSFKYRVKIFDGVSKYYTVKVVPRPQVAFVECVEQFPNYTGLAPVQRKPGDLGLLAGSVLHLKITANKEIKSALIYLAGLETNIVGTINATNRKQINASIKIPTNKLVGFSINLTDDFGISSKDQTLYRIDILPDKPPAIKIIYPERREELYTRLARILIGFEASDDYGLSAIKLHYKIEDDNKNLENVIDFDLGSGQKNTIRRRYEWNLTTLVPPPKEGTTIEYWLEAVDNNNETGPGIGYSERFIAKIVSEAEKRADLMNRVTEYISNLENVASEQEKLSKSLGEIILEKVKP
jgi:hypothetical protein